MRKHDWENAFRNEIKTAENARQKGNEGMARVCARRAAGIVIEEYFLRRGINMPNQNIQIQVNTLLDQDNLSPKIREVGSHLILNVTPDHTLPLDFDLISEVNWLAETLVNYQA